MAIRDVSRRALLAVALALGTLGNSCPPEELIPTPEELFLIDINNQWGVVGEDGHTFFFQPTNSSGRVSQASFTGHETLPTGEEFDLSGSFNQRVVQFTVVRDGQNIAYSGRFTDENTMDLTSQGRTLVLHKGG